MGADSMMARVLRWMMSAALASAVGCAKVTIARGPYVQDVRENSALVVWEGEAPPGASVGFGVQSTDERSAPATCEAIHCSALLSGLEPDTAYVYQVVQADGTAAPEGTIHTAPARSRPFTFGVFGDNRTDARSHRAVVETMRSVGAPEFLVHTGDMVESGSDEGQWNQFFAIEAELLRDVPIYPAVGNHEKTGGKAAILERLFHPPAAESGSTADTYYSFEWGNSHFIAIDGQIHIDDEDACAARGKPYAGCLDAAQQRWLEADLAKAAADPGIEHVFVFMHVGPYSSKVGRTGSETIRRLLGLFAESKVKLVISGHDHYYERGVSGNGLDYVISGGGGAPLYRTDPDRTSALWPHEIDVSVATHNFQIIEVRGSLIEVTSYRGDTGAVLDHFLIGEDPDCVAPVDCLGEEPGICEGSWTCPDFTCVWECAPPPACEVAADCPLSSGGSCPGHWECPFTGRCQWACDVVGECTVDADCDALEPLNACQGGHYVCETALCEWRCDALPPPAGPADDAGEPDAGADASMALPAPRRPARPC